MDLKTESDYIDFLEGANQKEKKNILLSSDIPNEIFVSLFFIYPEICIHNNSLIKANPNILEKIRVDVCKNYSKHRVLLKKILKSKSDKDLIIFSYEAYMNASDRDFRTWKSILEIIAKDQNTPPDILMELGNHRRIEISSLANKNPSMPASHQIKPKRAEGGKIERIYDENSFETMSCFVAIISTNEDVEGAPIFLEESEKIQLVEFKPFTALKRRVEVVCTLPEQFSNIQNPAISLAAWDKFKNINGRLNIALSEGFRLKLVVNDIIPQ